MLLEMSIDPDIVLYCTFSQLLRYTYVMGIFDIIVQAGTLLQIQSVVASHVKTTLLIL